MVRGRRQVPGEGNDLGYRAAVGGSLLDGCPLAGGAPEYIGVIVEATFDGLTRGECYQNCKE
jgi:hypothetical protein